MFVEGDLGVMVSLCLQYPDKAQVYDIDHSIRRLRSVGKGVQHETLNPPLHDTPLMFTQGKASMPITRAQVLLCAGSLEPAEVRLLEKGFLPSLQSLYIRWKQTSWHTFLPFPLPERLHQVFLLKFLFYLIHKSLSQNFHWIKKIKSAIWFSITDDKSSCVLLNLQ